MKEGRGVTAKIRWLGKRSSPDSFDRESGRDRWIHATPMLAQNGAVGVWIVILIDDHKSSSGSGNSLGAEPPVISTRRVPSQQRQYEHDSQYKQQDLYRAHRSRPGSQDLQGHDETYHGSVNDTRVDNREHGQERGYAADHRRRPQQQHRHLRQPRIDAYYSDSDGSRTPGHTMEFDDNLLL